MSGIVVDVKALFIKDVEYVLGHGIIATYQDGYLRDRDGNRICTDDYPVLPMLHYKQHVMAGEHTSTLSSPEDQYENVIGRAIESEEVLDKLKSLRNDDQKRIMELLEENMELSVENAKLKEDLDIRPRVVETENFKRVGDWIYIKSSGNAIPLDIINKRVITYDFPACPGRNGEIITESEKKIILRSEVGGLCMSEESIYGAMDIVIEHGTVEELLQVLQ